MKFRPTNTHRLRWIMSLSLNLAVVLCPVVSWSEDCSALSGQEAARCAFDEMSGEGLLDPARLPLGQSAVPHYDGQAGCTNGSCAGASETIYYQDVPRMNADATVETGTDAQFSAVVEMKTNANAWDLSASPPVTTAENVATNFSEPPATVETCTAVEVCTDEDVVETEEVCESPGVETVVCQVLAETTLKTVQESGTINITQSWCNDDLLYLQVRRVRDYEFVVEYLDTGPEGLAHKNCADGGGGWHQMATIRIPGPPLSGDETFERESLTVNFTGTHQGGCAPFTRTAITWSEGQQVILICREDRPPDQYGTLTLTEWTYAAVIRRDVLVDNCAPYRSTGSLTSSTCLDDTPRVIPDGSGQPVTTLPPVVPPALSCWTRQDEWIVTAPGDDQCVALNDDPGCRQTSAICLVNVKNRCERFRKTFICASDTTCEDVTVIQECTSCGTPGSFVPFCTDMSYPPNDQLFLAGSYLALVEDIENEWDPNTLQIFTGERLACQRSTIAPPIVDCCDSDPAKLIGQCSDEEILLAERKRDGSVHFVGDHCTDDISVGFGSICIEKEDVYCGFGTKLSRIIQQQGRAQIGKTFGDPERTNCDGFSVAEFQALTFDRMDLSEYYVDVNTEVDITTALTEVSDRVCATLGTCPP